MFVLLWVEQNKVMALVHKYNSIFINKSNLLKQIQKCFGFIPHIIVTKS